MAIADVLVVFRGVERIVCVCGGVTSLILGWNLFKAHILTNQNAEIENGAFKVKLSKVGPGAFFAVLGAAVLLVSLGSPLSVSTSDPVSPVPNDDITYLPAP